MREGSEVCVSWDFEAAGGKGNWTTDGCAMASNDDVVMCNCTHLTNFAILVVSSLHYGNYVGKFLIQ